MPRTVASLLGLGEELSPGFDLLVEGKDAGASGPVFEGLRPLISGVSYEEDEEMAALFELRVASQPDVRLGEGSASDWWAVIDCKAFQEGNCVDLFMGYAGVKQYMGRVEIVDWLPRGGPQGTGELTVKGYDGRHRMMAGNQFKAKSAKEPSAGRASTRGRVTLQGKPAAGTKGAAQKQRHVFRAMTDDAIVKKVAAKYGFAADCDPPDRGLGSKYPGGKVGTTYAGGAAVSAKYLQAVAATLPAELAPAILAPTKRGNRLPSRIQTAEQTDWQFLQKLAAINRFDLWVDFDLLASRWVVHFKRRQDVGNPILTFTYNGQDGSLIEWEGDLSVKDQSNTAEVVYFDRKTRTIQLTKIEDQSTGENLSYRTATPGSFVAKRTAGAGARVRFTAFGQTLEAVSSKPFRSQKDAEAFVKDWMRERERDLVVLKGKVVGVESLRPRQVHEFLGMSARLDGLYRLTQVKHVMYSGQPYTAEFVAHKVLSEEITRRKPTTRASVRVQQGRVTYQNGMRVEVK